MILPEDENEDLANSLYERRQIEVTVARFFRSFALLPEVVNEVIPIALCEHFEVVLSHFLVQRSKDILADRCPEYSYHGEYAQLLTLQAIRVALRTLDASCTRRLSFSMGLRIEPNSELAPLFRAWIANENSVFEVAKLYDESLQYFLAPFPKYVHEAGFDSGAAGRDLRLKLIPRTDSVRGDSDSFHGHSRKEDNAAIFLSFLYMAYLKRRDASSGKRPAVTQDQFLDHFFPIVDGYAKDKHLKFDYHEYSSIKSSCFRGPIFKTASRILRDENRDPESKLPAPLHNKFASWIKANPI